MRSNSSGLCWGVWLLVGCAANIAPKADTQTDPATTDESGRITSKQLADGVTESLVDATDDSAWQRFDLDYAREVRDANDDSDWDLAFNRFHIRSNGGASDKGGVELAQLPGQAFATLLQAPSAGFQQDQPDGPADDDDEPDNVFNNGDRDWYDYNLMNHTLSPADISYVVHSTDDRYFKLRIESYYDAAGTPAWLRFPWAELAGPAR
jgi:HmuY protein